MALQCGLAKAGCDRNLVALSENFDRASDLRTGAVAAALLLCLVLASGSASAGAVLGLDIVDPPGGISCGAACFDFTLGWRFVTADFTTVHALGIWDEGGDGLDQSHEVGLWSIDGTLLASTTVTPSSASSVASASGLGAWVFEPIPTLVLAAGTHAVGALYLSEDDPWRSEVDVGDLQVAPHLLTTDFTFFAIGDLLTFPDRDSLAEGGYFGPNLLITPEPSTSLLMGLGLLGITLAGRRPRAV